MLRDVSLVTGLAASGLSAGPTHTFMTPLTAARNAICLPSSLSVGPALSGLPNNTRRGMSGTSASVTGGGAVDGAGPGTEQPTGPNPNPPLPPQLAAMIAATNNTGRRPITPSSLASRQV